MHEVLEGRDGYDLIFQELSEKTFDLISSLYKSLNNYGFLCLAIKEDWSDIPKIILSSKDLEISYRQEKDRHVYYDGLKFYELYVRSNMSLLVLRKIVLNKRKIPCPKCNSKDHLCVNGYSSERVISWECKNPNCEKSEGGRGHRFSEITEIPRIASEMKEALIPSSLINKWRRDIEQERVTLDDLKNIAIKRYSYPWSKISLNEKTFSTLKGRKLNIEKPSIFVSSERENPTKVFNSECVSALKGNSKTIKYDETLKGFNIVYTSPPYYNAREYSQYDDLYAYFKEMIEILLNIEDQLNIDRFYINISDVVCTDQTYSANKVKRRFPISFMLAYYLEEVGIHLNKIYFWDKGEPQSKRHLNPNKTPVYNKPLNAFEYILVFSKEKTNTVKQEIVRVNPVIKINSKGVNKVKHTAPYPLALLEKTLHNEEIKGIVDPFLGSGTTAVWCKQWDHKCVGVELNDEYYEIACDNIDKAQKYFF